MGYGLHVWDKYGNKIFDPEDFVGRLVHVETVSANASGSRYIAEIEGKSAYPLVIPGPNFQATGDWLTGVQINSSTGYLSWSPPTSTTGESLIYVYLLE